MPRFSKTKAIALAVSFFGMVISDAETVKSEIEGLELEVTCPSSFAFSTDCVIDYTLEMRTNRDLKIVMAGEDVDLELRLICPNGEVLTPFPYPKGHYLMFYMKGLEQGKKQKFNVRVYPFFPLKLAGEYRCVLTRTVYEAEIPPRKRKNPLIEGKEVKISSPEFRFRIEKIDPSYVAPWETAHPTAVDSGSTTTPPSQPAPALPPTVKPSPQPYAPKTTEATKPSISGELASTPRLVWSVVILAAIGLLWLLLKKRRGSG